MRRQITRKTLALAVQLGGVMILATVSMLGLHGDSPFLSLGAYAFVVGCLLEAQSYASGRAEPTENTSDPPDPTLSAATGT
jgi:hypothetical protein